MPSSKPLAALPLLALACNAHPLTAPDPHPEEQTNLISSTASGGRSTSSSYRNLLVSGIFGWPTSGDGRYRVSREADRLTGGTGHWDDLPACQSTNGSATAALRVKQFMEAFGKNGSFESTHLLRRRLHGRRSAGGRPEPRPRPPGRLSGIPAAPYRSWSTGRGSPWPPAPL